MSCFETISDRFKIADSGIVQILAGKDLKRYFWHEDLIKRESPLIAAKIDKWHDEHPAATYVFNIEFREGAPDCFQIITDWLYDNDKSSLRKRLGELGSNFTIRLYEAALDLELERLQNDVMDHMRLNLWARDLGISRLIRILLYFQKRRANSPMRAFLVGALANEINNHPGRYAETSNSDPEQVAKLFAYPELAEELMFGVCDWRNPKSRKQGPFARSLQDIDCLFHKHDNGSECTAYNPFPG